MEGQLLYKDAAGNLHPVAKVDDALIQRAKAWLDAGAPVDDPVVDVPPVDDPPTDENPLPEPSGITVGPTDSLAEALRDAKNGENINLRGGTYSQRIWVDKPVNIVPYKHEKWVLDGRKPIQTTWQTRADGTLVGRFPATNLPFIWCGHHGGTPAGHADKMRPEVVTYKGKPLMWSQSPQNLAPGSFYIDGPTNRENNIYIKPFTWADSTAYSYAAYPNLISGPDGVSGVRIAGGDLRYASSTCHTGLLNVVWDECELEGLLIEYANTNGVKLGNNQNKPVCGLHATGVRAERCGQSGWWGAVCKSLLEHCTNSHNNWKNFAVQWEAGSKFERSSDSTWRHWLCENNNAVSFWFDIQNYRNTIEEITVRNGLKAGVMFEHYFGDSLVDGIYVDGIAKWNGLADAAVIQSNVTNNTFMNFHLSNAEKGARYKKKEGNDRDKGSGFNTFEHWFFDNIDEQEIYIEGSRELKPDNFKFAFKGQ